MLEKFITYYQKEKLFEVTDNILLTVSGGKDSMVMIHFFKQNNLSFGVAHCNFKLRGEAADKDEQFVKEFSERHNIPFYTIDFDTQEYATGKGISIQMAARELRYEWFEKIRNKNNYKYIATAHHKNDVAETMLINLIKGTGLAGLHGIANKYGKIIRPLLCFNRAEIDNYAGKHNVSFREDVSNSDTKYIRNSVRHNVIPELEKINPSIIETLNCEANQFYNDEKIIINKISDEKKRLFIEEPDGFKIEIKELKKLNPLASYLFFFLRDYGFNSSDAANIIEGLDGQSGKIFYSSNHEIVRDRGFLILKKREGNSIKKIEIKSYNDFPFQNKIIDITDDFDIEKKKEYAYLDADKIQFPMVLRTWEKGDVFQPFGMNGNKKVSDFLIDNKISIVEKKRVKVLESNHQIIWLVGKRIDDKFKITSSTKKVLLLSVED